MESLVKNSTSASETAIAAANSYKNIVLEIEKSLNAAKNASTAADDTIDKVYKYGYMIQYNTNTIYLFFKLFYIHL